MKFRQQPEDILKKIGVYSPNDIDLTLVAFSLGAHVKFTPLSDCEGYIVGTSEHAIISINNTASLPRQRFSLGHELGHWVNDRGKNLTYRCDSNDMKQQNSMKKDFRQQKEVRANKFSAQLLMPNHILREHMVPTDITWGQIRHIANTFNVSLTTAAIRFIEEAGLPCMLTAWAESGGRKWFVRGGAVPDSIWPLQRVQRSQLLLGGEGFSALKEVDADAWIDGTEAGDYVVMESQFFNGYEVLTLLWWKDESQLLDAL